MSAERQGEAEVSENVDRLLGEIDRAIGLIGQLREDNAALKEAKVSLEARLSDQTRELESVRNDRDRLQGVYDDNAVLIENKSEIQGKIEQMLDRLDAVHVS